MKRSQASRLSSASFLVAVLGCADSGEDMRPGVGMGSAPPGAPMAPAGPSGTGGIAPLPPAGSGGSTSTVPAAPVADAGTPTAPPPMDAGPQTPVGTAGSAAPGECAAPPAGTAPEAATALAAVNRLRLAAGAGCATLIPELAAAAQAHCEYYAQNSGMCTANAHNEMMGCTGFTGEGPGDRADAAGYTGRFASEVMAFTNDPEAAVAMWVNSVWHRLPILDPWTTELGYGHADNCDTIDFGRGTPAPDDTVVVYPYEGQVDVPTSFDGSREGPMPPAPTTGWPSASPVTVYAREMTVTEHLLTVDGDSAPIEHVWLTSAESNFLRNSIMMYANAPFAAQTTYRVKVTGTYVGGPLALEWTFKTGDPPRWRGGP